MSLPNLSLLEFFLVQLFVWFGLWMASEYAATLLTAIVVPIVFSILLIASISEFIERTKVPRKYFGAMAISIIVPILAAGVYWSITGVEHFSGIFE